MYKTKVKNWNLIVWYFSLKLLMLMSGYCSTSIQDGKLRILQYDGLNGANCNGSNFFLEENMPEAMALEANMHECNLLGACSISLKISLLSYYAILGTKFNFYIMVNLVMLFAYLLYFNQLWKKDLQWMIFLLWV